MEKTLDCFGDTLRVAYRGSMWVAACNGTQHATARGAMRHELEAYLAASGEDVQSEETLELIESLLDNME